MLQTATPLRKSAPWPPNISDEHVFCTPAPDLENASFQILCKCPTPAIVFGNARKLASFARFDKVHNPLRLPCETHLNVQKCCEHGVFCTFWLGTLLRTTAARKFSSLIWLHGSAPAALASLLFEPQTIGNTVFRDFATLSRAGIFFLLTLSLL